MKATKQKLEFKALELRVTQNSTASHTIYFKEHSIREQSVEKPPGRTLFIVNLPPYVDEQGLINAFSEAGPVKSVLFAIKPGPSDIKKINKFITDPKISTFRIAYIVFSKVAELDKALKLECLQPLNSESHQIKLGMRKWIDQYNSSVFQPKVLKEKIEEFMRQHDEVTQKAEKKEKLLEQEDDEGWVTVTKKGKVQSFARTEKVENKIMAKEAKGKKKKELKNFYTFQIRDSKMKHIVAMRQKFEEDKKKIAQIKQNRRFKPF